MRSTAALTVLAFVAGSASAGVPPGAGRPLLPTGMSCVWRVAAQGAPDNPLADPGSPWVPGERFDDASWRGLDDHMQRHHFGLWTAEEVAALEGTPGVAVAFAAPVFDLDWTGAATTPSLAITQWPAHAQTAPVLLVAVSDADLAHAWTFEPADLEVGPPRVGWGGFHGATPTLATTGFYRVIRIPRTGPPGAPLPPLVARHLPLNPWELQVDLWLSSRATTLGQGPILSTGTYTLRTPDSTTLDAPVAVHLSLEGPGADLFRLEVLPAAGEPASSSARDVRVRDEVTFRVVAPADVPAALVDALLPPGASIELQVRAEIRGFVPQDAATLDLGLSTEGFSVAPGLPVLFPPTRQLPPFVVNRSATLRIDRPAAP